MTERRRPFGRDAVPLRLNAAGHNGRARRCPACAMLKSEHRVGRGSIAANNRDAHCVHSARARDRTANADIASLKVGEGRMISVPDDAALRRNRVSIVELGAQESGNKLAWNIRRADIGPSMIDSTRPSKKRERLVPFSRTISARSANAALSVTSAPPSPLTTLGSVEAKTGHIAQRAGRPAMVGRQHRRLRRILDKQKLMRSRDFPERIHFGANPGVVHDKNRFGAQRNCGFDELLIEIECIAANVDEDRRGTAKLNRHSPSTQGKGRHNDLVARPEVGKNGRYFKRGRQECVSRTRLAPNRLTSHASHCLEK